MRTLAVTLADLFPANVQYSGERTPGLHVSDIVRDLCSQMEPERYPVLVRKEAEAERPRQTNPRWELGMAFEDQLGDRMADRYCRLYAPHAFRPGEITTDGIVGTPDVIDPLPHLSPGWDGITPEEPLIEEWKGTWLSSRHPIEGGKFTYWIWQGKSYCYMHQVLTLRIRALHIMGDYLFDKSPEPGPHFRTYEETYTWQELEEHWLMITKHAARMRAQGRA